MLELLVKYYISNNEQSKLTVLLNRSFLKAYYVLFGNDIWNIQKSSQNPLIVYSNAGFSVWDSRKWDEKMYK